MARSTVAREHHARPITTITLLTAILLAGLFSFLSCNGAGPQSAQSNSQRLAGTLKLPLDSDVPTLDPIHITDVRSASVARQIYSTLIRYDHDLRIVPDLAESWEVSADKLRLKFNLRQGARFSNGREVTAEDFVYSFNRLADPKEISERSTLLRDVVGFQDFRAGRAEGLAGLSAPDPHTFVIRLAKPYSPFLTSLAMINFAVVPREEVEAPGEGESSPWARHPVGSGPFKLADWKTDSHILLEANPDYYRGAPYLQHILYKVIPDLNTQFNAYLNNELHATNLPVGSLRDIMNDPEYEGEFRRKAQMAIQFYVFNMEKDPWKEHLFEKETKKYLRQALNYAINREYIANEILEGRYEPFVGIIPPALAEWHNPANRVEPRYTYDVDEARELLEKAGYPQGMFLPTIPMYYNAFSVYPIVALQVQDFLGDISVKVDPQVLEWSTFLTTMRNGDYLFGRSGWVADFPDPDSFLWQLLASENKGIHDNWARYSNPEFDQLVEEARVEFDRDKRRTLYWRAEQIALEDAPWLFLFAQTTNVLIKPEVRGLTISGMDVDASFPNVDFSQVYIKPAEAAPGAGGDASADTGGE